MFNHDHTQKTSSEFLEPVIEVKNLHKFYPSTKTGAAPKVAVEDVSFDVYPGEIFGILGPNGAGKTTTVECIAGLRQANGGKISVIGVNPQTHPEIIRRFVGVQFQEARLHDKITVHEAISLFASFYDDPADIEELLTLLDLQDKRDAQFKTLSGGQKQRLSIALALAGNPTIAVLDELTTGLDPQARRDVWQLVRRIADSGVTVLLVTHFMEEAERLCDRLVVIDKGRVAAQGAPCQLIRSVPGASSLEDVFVAMTGHDYLMHAGVAQF